MLPVLVISLKRAAHRRAEFSRRAAAAGIAFSFLDATDGHLDNVKDWAPVETAGGNFLSADGRCLALSEMACTHSHHLAWREILRVDAPGAVILEDDVLIRASAGGVIAFLEETSEEWRERNAMIYLTCGHRRDWLATHVLGHRSAADVPHLGRFLRIRRFRGPLWGTSAYFITAHAARSLLAVEERLVRLSDAWMERAREGSLTEVWLCQPPCFEHQEERAESFLESDRLSALQASYSLKKEPSVRSFVTRKAVGLIRRSLLDPWLRIFG